MNDTESTTKNPTQSPALQAASEVAELDPGAFNRALKVYLAKRGFKFKLSKPPADAEGAPLYGLHRRHPARAKPLAKKTLEGWRRWFLDGGSLDELRSNP